ncbi:Uma2 family endonuclease [Gloeothece verrucosa]|uniref:Putative restriction endonuclease domain-containing protein n=1 Tax=Gloeothece verrucosa (strain PCC 7822) TaxID=497965 RepID=E0UB93_GLOV7|nr:Uma2 family endonuclease [Gloeothece verrucosa]ADN17449.1 protein of unknown function DUF820 [Gloeothece verrucosa PCC 7822]
MSQLKTVIPTDTWFNTTWQDYLEILEPIEGEKGKSYYYKGKSRLEMSPLGNDHGRDHLIIIIAVSLFASLRGIPINGTDNCTYRKTGTHQMQPDVSYYIGDKANIIPWGTSIVDLDVYPPPDLVIEVANTSLADDKGEKRLLYEDLNIQEYWIVDVQNLEIIAFKIVDGGSKRITDSQVLPGLAMSLLEETLQRTRHNDQSQVINGFLSQLR